MTDRWYDRPTHECRDCANLLKLDNGERACIVLFANNNDRRCECFVPIIEFEVSTEGERTT